MIQLKVEATTICFLSSETTDWVRFDPKPQNIGENAKIRQCLYFKSDVLTNLE